MRLRTSLLVENNGRHLLIDSSPDLRAQLLEAGSPHIDAVIWTHGHYDHFIGFGEFYRIQKIPPVFAAPQVLNYCAEIFRFLTFDKGAIQPYEPFDIFGITVTPFMVRHPPAFTCGMLFETGKSRVAYTSDTNIDIPGAEPRAPDRSRPPPAGCTGAIRCIDPQAHELPRRLHTRAADSLRRISGAST